MARLAHGLSPNRAGLSTQTQTPLVLCHLAYEQRRHSSFPSIAQQSSRSWVAGVNGEMENEHNVGDLALEVVGQNLPGEVVSLFLEDWELSGPFMPRNEGCVLCELCSQCQSSSLVELSQR